MSARQTTPAQISEDGGVRVREAATFLGLSPATLYRLSARGVIPSVKVGRALVFRRRDLSEILERGLAVAEGGR